MCSNYRPVTRADRMLAFFGVERARDEPPHDVWPLGLAPFIRLAEDGSGQARCDDGVFGLLPHFATELAYGRRTYNARSETVHRLPSFRDAWRRGQRCIVPVECVYEPNWESGRAVRWAVLQPGDVPFGIAGIWRGWKSPDGRELLTFAMLTVNADGHPVFGRLHRPGDEKRMVVIIDPKQYAEWLTCPVDEAPKFFRQWQGPLQANAAALAPRAPASSSVRSRRPPVQPQ
jgi:putative SOS response-associated peptidase YedK